MSRLFSILTISVITMVSGMSIADAAQPVQKFKVVGTEPFWSLQVSQRGFIYHTPEVSKRKISNYVRPLTAQNRTADSLRVYRMQNNNTLIIQKESCSDGMSDINYPYSAVLMMGSKVLAGCASLGN